MCSGLGKGVIWDRAITLRKSQAKFKYNSMLYWQKAFHVCVSACTWDSRAALGSHFGVARNFFKVARKIFRTLAHAYLFIRW